MRYELFIADRYLRSKQRTGFISLITYISAGGVLIGVAALVIVMSVMNGFETEVRERIVGQDAHLKVTLFHEEPMRDWTSVEERLKALPNVTGASPYIQGKGMLRRRRSIEGSIIKGIDENSVGQVGELPEKIIAGSLSLKAVYPKKLAFTDSLSNLFEEKTTFNSKKKTTQKPLPGIVIGRQLAFRMGVTVGDCLIAVSPSGMAGMLTVPKLTRFAVSGVFETGIYEYDDAFSFISIEAAQDLFELKDAVTGIELKLDDMNKADRIKVKIEDEFGYPYYARTWYEMHRTLFHWMKLEKWLYLILLSLIILVAAFNIISSQIMMVLEKKREIGILRAIGATREDITRIFLYEGLIVGGVGTVFGLILGWAFSWAQQTYKFITLPGDVYLLSYFPVRMQITDFIIIAVVSMILTLLATVYPAHRAGSLDPVEAIRYE
ncbi:MAG: ABC transporter permease [Candidatus Hatepunaea meridiana]|nr:ABC transporter permease [Candidatus Hatepunaea meridiana]